MWWTQYLLPIFFLGLIIWTHYILFIGDVREMVDCNKTEVFLKEWKRMCDVYSGIHQQCPLYKMSDVDDCYEVIRKIPYQVIDAVQE